MSDLFSDPILFLPVIAILAIFSAFYVSAMVWSYNRDAKKQGKKSGCMPVLLVALAFTVVGCHSGTSRMLQGSKDEVWQAVQEGHPSWLRNHRSAFRNNNLTADIKTHEWGRSARYRISVEPKDDYNAHQHEVTVKFSEKTGLFNEWPSSKDVCVEEEVLTLDQIERRLNTIQQMD